MQRIFAFIVIILLNGCSHLTTKSQQIVLGDKSQIKAWIYLCGLTSEWNSPEEANNRKILARIAAEEHIKIIAIKPFSRCNQFNKKLCWPHDNRDQVQDTYARIITAIPDTNIAGFIGFSNGGFFLNQLSQEFNLNEPVISISSGGHFDLANSGSSEIYLIIGKQDNHHYKGAVEFHNQAKKHKNTTVKLITHDGGHVIPENIVRELIHDLRKSQGSNNDSHIPQQRPKFFKLSKFYGGCGCKPYIFITRSPNKFKIRFSSSDMLITNS